MKETEKEKDDKCPLEKSELDQFTSGMLHGCLEVLTEMPSTVFKACDVLSAVAQRNGEEWKEKTMIHILQQVRVFQSRDYSGILGIYICVLVMGDEAVTIRGISKIVIIREKSECCYWKATHAVTFRLLQVRMLGSGKKKPVALRPAMMNA